MRSFKLGMTLIAAAIVVGCGGDGSDSGVNNTLARGALVANPPSRVPAPQADGTTGPTLQPSAFAQMLDTARPGTTLVTGVPKCGISTYHMKYGTLGGAGEATDATGAIMVPSGTDPACSGPRPVLLYAHGTTTDKAFNMANLRDNAEASMVAATYAAQGFIVIAPNYAGYDGSSLSYHPYLNAEQQANDMVDGLRAARKAFPNIAASDSGKLLIAGYSQGGYVAMATQRAMQTTYASEFKVTALAGLSGPYALALLGDAVFGGRPNAGGTIFLPMITTSWQKSYGGVYGAPSDVYESNYASGIESLLPSTSSINSLFAAGKLPQLALFAQDSLPQAPGFAAFFGAGNLVKTSYRNQYLADAAANPCSVDPATPLACAPANPFRKAGIKNDLRNYVPNVPVMLCGGNADPTVFFASTQAAQGYFLAKGMPAAALTVLDVDTAATGPTDPFAAAKAGFAQAKTATINAATAAGANPAAAVAAAYHGSLVAPFCSAAARGYFQTVLAQ
ncbi:hypothetical protein D3870_03595 [Noviherbaspirillum cavernae]|uniref:Peptidase S9 prolyl oligopeptidase catalytic domain-containing protein n=1 Tax=Noviherbaspirillum cavernae TaxID=2320862 RepID=A0A418WYR8_9BURK|nr:prolyl oligopeptidase family serine peptidase [Noviherbaspirillum cavernae]RJG05225.1 hypothetical protein D3870_03595 [Noviherbaspirillum cavernae]